MTQADLVAQIKAMDRCWMDGRFDDLKDHLAEDVVLVAPDGAGRLTGLANAIKSYRQFMSAATVERYKTSDHLVTLRGDTAVAEYAWDMAYSLNDMRHEEQGREVLVFARRDGGWRVVWRTQIPTADASQ